MHQPPITRKKGTVLLGCERRRLRRCVGFHRDMHLALRLTGESHLAVDQGEDRVVTAEADVVARIPLSASLTNQDVARDDGLAAELFDAQAPTFSVAAVA
jgi:hypothetical protein